MTGTGNGGPRGRFERLGRVNGIGNVRRIRGDQRLRRRVKFWVAAALTTLVLLAGGAFAIAQIAGNRYEVPRADLLGTPSPTPGLESAPTPTPSPTVEPGADIRGPLNILLVGVDTRVTVPDWVPHSDAVLILHVTENLDRAYLFSLPRDLIVDVPRFPKAGYGGGRSKLTDAFAAGSRKGRGRYDAAQGFQLLTQVVSNYTGIKRFDAGAILNFPGFSELIDEIGGVDLYVDQLVKSQHKQPNGKQRTLRSGGYVGPQMIYRPGVRHLKGWQALDYARQRYTDGGDYTRQRHQQQLIKAVLAKALSSDMLDDPLKVDRVIRALGRSLIFDGRERSALDFAWALRGIRPQTLTLVSLPGAGVGSGSGYRGEQLKPIGRQFIAELRAGRADRFLRANPGLVVRR